jgi:hypothetical protein
MLQIECYGVTVLSTTECENTYCLTLPPTEDPLFSRQAQLTWVVLVIMYTNKVINILRHNRGLDIPNNYQLKQISIALSTQTVRFTSASVSCLIDHFDYYDLIMVPYRPPRHHSCSTRQFWMTRRVSIRSPTWSLSPAKSSRARARWADAYWAVRKSRSTNRRRASTTWCRNSPPCPPQPWTVSISFYTE